MPSCFQGQEDEGTSESEGRKESPGATLSPVMEGHSHQWIIPVIGNVHTCMPHTRGACDRGVLDMLRSYRPRTSEGWKHQMCAEGTGQNKEQG